MAYEFKLPELGEGVEKGVVVKVFVSEGDEIGEDEALLEVESDKAVLSVPSPVGGRITEILVSEGEEVNAGQVLARIDTEGAEGEESEKDSGPAQTEEAEEEGAETEVEEKEEGPEKSEERAKVKEEKAPPREKKAPAGKETPKEKVREKEGKEKAGKKETGKERQAEKPSYPPPSSQSYDEDLAKIPAGPAARKMARELGVDLRKVKGSKRGGRIGVEDIKDHVKFVQSGLREGSSQAAHKELPDFTNFGSVHREELSLIRKVISQRMSASWDQIPHVFQFNEADVTDISEFHQKYSDDFKEKGSTTSLTTFVIKALSQCLSEFPQFNASLDSESNEIIFKDYFHIGVAVDTPAGLMVPVIKNVDQLSIFDIGVELRELAQKARNRKVTPEDLKGACITVSNLGGIGGSYFTPLINPPEVAILGVGRNRKKPVWQDGEWVPREMLPLCLSYDHRVIDGADGARFIVRFSEILQNFERFLLGG